MDRLAWMLFALPLLVCAATPEEDEARIEELIRAERTAAAAAPIPAQAPESTLDILPRAGEPAFAREISSATAAATGSFSGATAQQSPARTFDDDWGADLPATAAPAVRFEDLAKHVGERLRFFTTGGKHQDAELASVDSRGVTLRRHLPSGYAAYTLPRSQVEHIETR